MFSMIGLIMEKRELRASAWIEEMFCSSQALSRTRMFAALLARGRQHDMSKNNTSKVVRYSRDNLPPDRTDWARINAMTDEEVTAAALSDPDAQPLTPEQLARMRRVSRVKVLRQRLGMTQVQFAEAFHLPITTLRDWEQHRSTPDAPARALLLAIERDPEVMRRLLAEAAA